MIDPQFRHPYPEDTALARVLDQLPDGVAVSLRQLPPYWDVCVRRKGTDGREYFVTDCSAGKPQRVTEPVASDAKALAQARDIQLLWLATHVSFPEWPWE